jgi:hypothetical protein
MDAILSRLDVIGAESSVMPACEELLQELYNLIVNSNGDGIDSALKGPGLAILWNYISGEVSQAVHRLAFRCLANAVMLSEPTRQTFVTEEYPTSLIKLMKVCSLSCIRTIYIGALTS